MIERAKRAGAAMLAACAIGAASAAYAQDPAEKTLPDWSNSTELGWLVTTGNARSGSVGLRNVYLYEWPVTKLSWEAGWIRAVSRDGDRFAIVADSGGFDVVEPGTAVDSQRLFSKLRYQRQLSTRHDWFGNMDTVRDEPANINRQFVFAGGLGTTWCNSEAFAFRTSYGVTYTDEDLAIEGVHRFGGYRLFYGLKAIPAAPTTVESELTFDGSFDVSDDVRTDWLNSMSVAISASMALKASFRVLFRNVPALEELDLETPALGVVLGTVEVPKHKTDTNFTTSLVVTF